MQGAQAAARRRRARHLVRRPSQQRLRVAVVPLERPDPRHLREKGVRSPKRRKLAHAFLWEYSYKRLKLAQLLGQLSVFLTLPRSEQR
jgi:hypothetical protein